ncbi:MAG: hypothetical protein AAF074_09530 [Pseudomonadota bacterium]
MRWHCNAWGFWRGVGLAAALLLAALPARSEDLAPLVEEPAAFPADAASAVRVIGRLKGIFGERFGNWYVTEADGAGQSGWAGGRTHQTLRLQAYSGRGVLSAERDVVLLYLRLVDEGDGLAVEEPEIVYLPPKSADVFRAAGAAAGIDVDSLYIDGNELQVQGSFSAKLSAVAPIGDTGLLGAGTMIGRSGWRALSLATQKNPRMLHADGRFAATLRLDR